MLCPSDLDLLVCKEQRLFYRSYPQINEVRKSSHMVIFGRTKRTGARHCHPRDIHRMPMFQYEMIGDFQYVKLKPNRGCRYNLLRFQSDKASSSRSSSSSPSLSACGSTKRNDNSFNAYNNTIHGKWFGPRNISCLSRVHVVFRKTCW